MSDRESGIPPLRRSYEAARQNFEQVGLAGIPRELEREQLAQIGLQIADLSPMQPGLERGWEAHRLETPIVAGQFGLVELSCADGFYFEWARFGATFRFAVSTVQATIVTPGGTDTAFRWPAIPGFTVRLGTTAAALTGLIITTTVPNFPRIWIPPNYYLQIGIDAVATPSDHQVQFSGVRV